MKHVLGALLTATVLAAGGAALAQETPSPDGAREYIIAPQDGATVSSPVTVQFGLQGMGVAPAGVEKANTGHHHLVIDQPPFGEGDAAALAEPIPADDNHIHFGGGQTETTVELTPGQHTLQLVLGDQNHIPLNPPVMSERITITVE